MMNKPWLAQYEGGVPRTIEIPKIPVFQFLTDTAHLYPDKVATSFYGKTITYRQLEEKTKRFATFLLTLGVQKGDRIAVMLPNIPQCVIAYYGALKTGAVVVMFNPLYVEREIEQQLVDCGATVIVALDIFYPRIGAVFSKTSLRHVVITSVKDALPWPLALVYPIKAKKEGQWARVPNLPHIHRMPLSESATALISSVLPSDLALLQYTGGTTGTPKGVMLTHENLVANTLQCRAWTPTLQKGEEVFLAVIPFFHVYGMSVCMNLAIALGAKLVLLPRFATKDVLTAIQKSSVTVFMGVQAMYTAINNYPNIKQFNLSSIRVCISGAGPLHVEVQKQFETLTGGRLVEGFGLSEASPVTHANLIHGKRKKASIGLPVPNTDARIVDLETGTKEVPCGEVGELVVKGPQVMQGYWNHKEETAKVIRDGWLHTGDMAKQDEEGFFFIVDRKKDMIKTRGENVYPREVEEVLFRYDKVVDAVVVGLPDPFGGEKIKAYIVVKPGATVTTDELLDFCKQHLARFKVPQEIEVRTSLPKTIIGKVLRRVLVEEELKKSQLHHIKGSSKPPSKEM